MQNPIWKFTALAGVIGATCLAVVMLQRSAENGRSENSLDGLAEDTSEAVTGPDLLADEESARVLGQQADVNPEPAPFNQNEPAAQSVSLKQTADPEAEVAQSDGLDFNEPAIPPVEDPFTGTVEQANATTEGSSANVIPIAGEDAEEDIPRLLFDEGAEISVKPIPNVESDRPEDSNRLDVEEDSGPALIGGNAVPVPAELLEEPTIRQTAESSDEPAVTNPLPSADPPVFDPFDVPSEETPENVESPAFEAVDPMPDIKPATTEDDFPPLDGFEFAPEEPNAATPDPDAARLLDEPVETGIPELDSTASDDAQSSEDPDDPFKLDALDQDATKPSATVSSPAETGSLETEPSAEADPVLVDPLEGFEAIEETIRSRNTDSKQPASIEEPTEVQSPQPVTGPLPNVPGSDPLEPAPLSPSPEISPVPVKPSSGISGSPGDTDSQADTDSTTQSLLGDAVIDRPLSQSSMRPQLKIEKTAPPTATLGQPFIYHIDISNTGQTTAREVVVEDRIPKGAELTGTIPRATLDGTTLIWKLGEVPPGASSRISIRVIPRSAGSIGSIATVRSAAEVAAETRVTVPTLSFTMESESEVRLGQKAIFRYTVKNAGPGNASGVTIRNAIPDGLNHPDGNDLEYEVGTLRAGESRSVRLSLETTRGGMVTNQAELTANGGIKIEASAKVEVTTSQLSLRRTGPTKRFVGRSAEFENHVTNDSDKPVSQARVIERVPEGMDFVEASGNGRFDKVERIVYWNLDQLAPQQSAVLKVKLVPRDTGSQRSVVEIVEATGNRSQAVSETEVAGYASLGLDLSEVDRPLAVGERLIMTVRARNRGTAAAQTVQVSLELPAELDVLGVKSNNQVVEFVRTENLVKLPVMASFEGQQQTDYEIVLLARGDATTRIRAQVNAEGLSAPITRDEAILIVPDN